MDISYHDIMQEAILSVKSKNKLYACIFSILSCINSAG
jgi:hypothetical protein